MWNADETSVLAALNEQLKVAEEGGASAVPRLNRVSGDAATGKSTLLKVSERVSVRWDVAPL